MEAMAPAIEGCGERGIQMITRRSILCGLLAAPIVVRPGLLMPVRPAVDVMPQLVFDGDEWESWPRVVGLCRVIADGESVIYSHSHRIAATKMLLRVIGRPGANAPS